MNALRQIAPKDRIIFPLDFYSFEEAASYVTSLKQHVGLFKVGYALLLREGRSVLNRLYDVAGTQLFVDLKFHDIPRTVQQAASALVAASDAIRFLTVHTCDGDAIIRAAVEGVKPGVGVLGVTVLTSQPARPVRQEGVAASEVATSLQEQVVQLARVAKQAGCEGIVCSGYEVQAVKQAIGHDLIVVTPGIRPSWAEVTNDDQQRAMTPGEAITHGADYLVIGRPIAKARDPVHATEQIIQEIEQALQSIHRTS